MQEAARVRTPSAGTHPPDDGLVNSELDRGFGDLHAKIVENLRRSHRQTKDQGRLGIIPQLAKSSFSDGFSHVAIAETIKQSQQAQRRRKASSTHRPSLHPAQRAFPSRLLDAASSLIV